MTKQKLSWVLPYFMMSWLLVFLCTRSDVLAFETDQLTYRDRDLNDVGPLVNERLNEWLEVARVNTENTLKVKWSDERIAAVMRSHVLGQHSVGKAMSGTPLELWMKNELLAEYGIYPAFFDQGKKVVSIYSEYRTMVEGWGSIFRIFVFDILSKWIGQIVAPTFEVNGHRFGTDKLTHFFRLGSRLYDQSYEGTRPDLAARYGTYSENNFIGKKTDGVFSFADAAANFSGFEFYRDLVQINQRDTARSPMFRITRNHATYPWVRIEKLRPFQISDYISDDWDEYYNPSSYSVALQGAIDKHLMKYHDRYCDEFSRWSQIRDLDQRRLRSKADYIDVTQSPEQSDPFEMKRRCSSSF